MRLLLIEDDIRLSEALKLILEDNNYSVDTAGDGEFGDGESYRFYKAELVDGTGTFIIFIYNHSDNEMLWNLFLVLAFTGLGGLVLAFFGSLFMAERSLVPIKKSWQQQRDFVADASHELRAFHCRVDCKRAQFTVI